MKLKGGQFQLDARRTAWRINLSLRDSVKPAFVILELDRFEIILVIIAIMELGAIPTGLESYPCQLTL